MACRVHLLQGMKVAISNWQGRISPVFDVAGSILLLELEGRREKCREELELKTGDPFDRARFLSHLGADVLICGMLSHPQEIALASAGIRVIPHICGEIENVITAFLSGRLDCGALTMPGCGRQFPESRRRRRQRRFRVHPGQ
jgi:predicted Fe-Mo cluster-binding NifX family protein